VAVDAQEPQEYFLYQVLDIGSTMAEARREEALQTLPMLPLQIRYERLLVA
jgi:hypothetical protein